MENKHEGCVRGFHSFTRAWYAQKDKLPRVSIGFYHPDGGTTGEFGISWVDLGSGKLAPRLEVFNDAWDALTHFKDLLDKLSEVDGMNLSEMQICNLMEDLGIEDLTDYKMRKK